MHLFPFRLQSSLVDANIGVAAHSWFVCEDPRRTTKGTTTLFISSYNGSQMSWHQNERLCDLITIARLIGGITHCWFSESLACTAQTPWSPTSWLLHQKANTTRIHRRIALAWISARNCNERYKYEIKIQGNMTCFWKSQEELKPIYQSGVTYWKLVAMTA